MIKVNKLDSGIKWNIFNKICSYGVVIIALIFSGFIAINSMIQTSVIDPKNFVGEKILYEKDNLFLNILFILLFVFIALALYNLKDYILKINDRTIMVALFIYTVVVGIIWVLKVQSVPQTDAGYVFSAVQGSIKGDMTPFRELNDAMFKRQSYFHLYSYQLGMVFIEELICRIGGHETALFLEVVNVVALASAYVALLKIAKKIWNKKGLLFVMAIFLATALQPILFTTFGYGNIISFSAGIWATYFSIKFMHSESKFKWVSLIFSVVFVTISVLAKYNSMIIMLSIVIGLIIFIINKKDWKYFVAIPIFILVPILASNLVVRHYEDKATMDYRDGVSQKLYLCMGLNDSAMAPGWYNGIAKGLFTKYNNQIEPAEKEADENISARMKTFREDPAYAYDFFSKKVLSQWNEPSFESIWVSQVKSHYYGNVEKTSWLDGVYNGDIGKRLYAYFDIHQMIMMLLLVAGLIALLKYKFNPDVISLLTILVGGYLYHLLFEGKSQYILVYYILIVFFASFGAFYLLSKYNVNFVKMIYKLRKKKK